MTKQIEVPSGPGAPLSNVASGIKAARVVAFLTALAGIVVALVLVTADLVDPGAERVSVALGIAVLAISLALAVLLLFLAGWAESTTRP